MIFFVSTSLLAQTQKISVGNCVYEVKPAGYHYFTPESIGDFIIERKGESVRVSLELVKEIPKPEGAIIHLGFKKLKDSVGPTRWFQPPMLEEQAGVLKGSHRITQYLDFDKVIEYFDFDPIGAKLETGSSIERFEVTETEVFIQTIVHENRSRWVRCQILD